MPRPAKNHVLKADFSASVTQLPVAELKSREVLVLAFDLDNTLAHKRTRELTPEVITYMRNLSEQGFKIILASNALTDLTRIAGVIHATAVPALWYSRKPFGHFYRRVITAAGCPPHQIAMIGDRYINDIVGANLAGLVTIHVGPLGGRG
jgi:HAD superfamily phosphatase (TIGR01668 family)